MPTKDVEGASTNQRLREIFGANDPAAETLPEIATRRNHLNNFSPSFGPCLFAARTRPFFTPLAYSVPASAAVERAASAIGLNSTVLQYADLSRANLTHATLGETVFASVDLTSVIGLETCHHLRPSIIDVQTLQQSGSLPLPFLRGIGLPEPLIDYLPSLFNQAIRYYSCFISYSTKDQEFAERLHADLQNKGIRCWYAPHDMPIGGKILDEIDAAMRMRDKVLLILSEHSIKSEWVEDEVTKGFAEERKRSQIVLFPIRLELDDAVMDTNEAWAAKLLARNVGDFRHWTDHNAYKKGLERVIRDLTLSQKRG